MGFTSASLNINLTDTGVDPDDITKLTGITPTATARKGQPAGPRGRILARGTHWVVRLEQVQGTSAEAAIRALLAHIATAKAAFRAIARDHLTGILVWVETPDQIPELVIPEGLVAELADLGLYLSFEIYVDDSADGST